MNKPCQTPTPPTWAQSGLLFLGYFILALLLWGPVLNSFFIFDDISNMASASPIAGKSFLDSLLPVSNGFWRPIPFSLLWIVTFLFGPSPVITHLLMVFFHTVNALLVVAVARSLAWSSIWSHLCGLLFLVHFLTFISVATMQNSMDVMMTTFHLLGLLVISSGLTKRNSILLIALLILAAMCKETAVVFPAIALVWWFVTQFKNTTNGYKKVSIIFGILFIISIVFAGIVFWVQSNTESYLSDGRFGLGPVSVIRQWTDYLFSMFFPYIHLTETPFVRLTLPHSVLWLFRLVTLGGFVLTGWWCWSKRNWLPLAMLLCASLSVAPACFLVTAPHARYAYPALPFICLFIVWFMQQLSGIQLTISKVVFGALVGLFLTSFYTSPTVRNYRNTAHAVQQFVEEVERLSPEWKKNSEVAIYNHPHPGNGPWRWSYCQLIFDLFIPDAQASLALEKTTQNTSYSYRFENGKLLPLKEEE